jgi:hypothetical protein
VKKSDKFSERLIDRSKEITYDNKIYIPQSLINRTVVVSCISTMSRDNTHGSETETKPSLAQPLKGCGSGSKELP